MLGLSPVRSIDRFPASEIPHTGFKSDFFLDTYFRHR
jgi:hypothetical protein